MNALQTGFVIISAVLLTALWPASAEEEAASDSQPVLTPLFNGENLDGWKVPEGNVWFHAAEGVLQVRSGPGQKEATLWTETDYGDFLLELEFKFGEGTVDSGVFIKTTKEQIQIGISGSLKRDMTALAYIAGKGYPVQNDEAVKLLKEKDWNHLKIRVRGKTYETWLNGEPVMTYTSETAENRGPLGIQLHGNRDMAIDFRKIAAAKLE